MDMSWYQNAGDQGVKVSRCHFHEKSGVQPGIWSTFFVQRSWPEIVIERLLWGQDRQLLNIRLLSKMIFQKLINMPICSKNILWFHHQVSKEICLRWPDIVVGSISTPTLSNTPSNASIDWNMLCLTRHTFQSFGIFVARFHLGDVGWHSSKIDINNLDVAIRMWKKPK